MKKFFIVMVVALFSTMAVKAQTDGQSYQSAVGLRIWDGAGVTFKHFFNEKNAGELIGYFWGRGVRVTGLYEIHNNIESVEGLKWYIGPGAHVGFYGNKWGNGAFFGIDGVIGLDYKINKAPINLSLDWQPSFEFGDSRGFYGAWGGLSVRYTFK